MGSEFLDCLCAERKCGSLQGLAVLIETYVPGYHGDTYGQTPVLEFHHYLCAVRKFGTLQELADLIETAAQQSIAYFAAKEEA